MQDYSKLYKPIYKNMTSKNRLREIRRILKTDVKPLAMLIAIAIVANSRP